MNQDGQSYGQVKIDGGKQANTFIFMPPKASSSSSSASSLSLTLFLSPSYQVVLTPREGEPPVRVNQLRFFFTVSPGSSSVSSGGIGVALLTSNLTLWIPVLLCFFCVFVGWAGEKKREMTQIQEIFGGMEIADDHNSLG